MSLDADLHHVCFLLRSSLFLAAMIDGTTETFAENVATSGFAMDVRNFAGVGILVIDVPHNSHLYQLGVSQNCRIHASYRLFAPKFLQ